MNSPSVRIDPLDSPYPIPWNWVWATQTEAQPRRVQRYYRTQALLSPDGEYAAYSRLQMQVAPEFTESWVSSVLFVESLQTGDLHTIVITSPLADNPFAPEEVGDRRGTISMVIPIAWSEGGDRLLAREFESAFGSDIASDFAVLWDRPSRQSCTIAPTGISFTHAILLGWSRVHPDRALFRAGTLGEPDWSCWSVDATGKTELAQEDGAIAFGQPMSNVWMGPQAF